MKSPMLPFPPRLGAKRPMQLAMTELVDAKTDKENRGPPPNSPCLFAIGPKAAALSGW